MKLSEGRAGYNYIVLSVNLKTEVKRRLEVLGMTECSTVSVIKKRQKGAMIIKVRGTRFAIGYNFACGILVGGESE